MNAPRIGSLFSGAGMLDEGVRSVIGGTVAWHAEVEPAACRVLDYRYPSVPNLGDVTSVDWAAVEPVDVITGGSPCQDVSAAGKRAGMRAGTRSGLWASMVDAIDVIRPSLVVWENVRGVLSAEADSSLEPCAGCVGDGDDRPVLRALGRVVGDLAELGYVGRWHGLRAADVGAPHGRFRIFVVAYPGSGQQPRAAATGYRLPVAAERGVRPAADADGAGLQGRRPCGHGSQEPELVGDRATAADASRDGRHEGRPEPAGIVGGSDAAERGADAFANALSGRWDGRTHESQWRALGRVAAAGDRADAAADSYSDGREGVRRITAERRDADRRGSADVAWGIYEPAIRRWERLTRPAPSPTEIGPKGGNRLSARFTEWMQGWPDGWVTDVPGVSRNEALKLCGNGVVPQQAAEAVRRMLTAQAVAA